MKAQRYRPHRFGTPAARQRDHLAEPLEARTLLSATYDAATSFSATVNPGPIWSYGDLATESSPFVAYPVAGSVDIGGPVRGWHTADTAGPPYVASNPTTDSYSSGSVVVPAGALDMHPGPSGEYSDTRFTVPTAGAATIAVTFTGLDVDGTTTDVHVLHNGVSIADGLVNGYGAAYTQSLSVASVAAGDTIDFIVGFGSNQNYYSDSTQLSAQITLGAAAAAPVKSIGGLDPTFGAGGLASHDVGFTSTNAVAADGTQSVLVGPIGNAPSESFGLTRYDADGSVDATFGTGGVTTTPFTGTDAVPSAVAILADGDILVAGTATTYAADGVPVMGSQFAVAEYTPAGALDTTFGTGGQVLLGFGSGLSNDVLRALAVGPGGILYLGGSSDAAGQGNDDLAVASLTPTGAPNTAFATTGTVLTDVAADDDRINGLAVQTNGDIVAAGTATVGGAAEVALARYLPTGALDARFGTKVSPPSRSAASTTRPSRSPSNPRARSSSAGSPPPAPAARSPATSSSNATRPPARSTARSAPPEQPSPPFGQPSAITQVLVQSDGTIVASGRTAATLDATTLDVAIAKYSDRGVLVAGFGTARQGRRRPVGRHRRLPALAADLGAAFNAFADSEQGTVAVTTGGEILAAGSTGPNTVEAELITAGVDLVAKLLSAVPASVLSGAKGTASVTVTESGTDAAKGSVTITIEFASDAAGTDATPAKSLPERVSLKQGQGKTFKVPFTYPAAATAADYYLLATVTNGAGIAADLDPDNNAAASPAPVAVAPAFVALVGSALSTTGALSAGKAVTVTIDVMNGGNVSAKGKGSVDFYLSPDDTTADGTDVGVATLTVGIAAGKSHPFKLKFTLPTSVTSGSYTLLAVVDAAKSLG